MVESFEDFYFICLELAILICFSPGPGNKVSISNFSLYFGLFSYRSSLVVDVVVYNLYSLLNWVYYCALISFSCGFISKFIFKKLNFLLLDFSGSFYKFIGNGVATNGVATTTSSTNIFEGICLTSIGSTSLFFYQ